MTGVRAMALAMLLGTAACGSKTPAALPGAAPGAPIAPEPIFDVSKSAPGNPCPPVPADQQPPANSRRSCAAWNSSSTR